MNQKGFMERWLFTTIITVAIVGGVVLMAWGIWGKITESYREEGRDEMRPVVAELEGKVEQLTAMLEKQTLAVREFKTAAERRMAAANRARAAAEKQAAALANRVIQLETAQPAFPDDPCRSACKLLEETTL